MRDVLLVGMGMTAATALQSLTADCRVVGLVRSTDAGARASDPAISWARRHGIPVFDDTSIAGIRALMTRLEPDCVVVSSFDRILPDDLLSRCAFVNVHYAPLPRYRGRANVNWAVMNGEAATAMTIHALDRGLDTGHVLFQQLVPIGPDDTVADLYDRLNALQLAHLGETVNRFLDGYAGTPQDGALATYGCTRLPADGEIDWSAPTTTIAALVRGLVRPFPGAFTHVDGRPVVIWRARAVDAPPVYAGRIPGRVVAVSRDEGYVDVLTGDGILRIEEVEADGGGAAPAAAVIRSVRSTLGLRTADLLARIEQLERDIARLREQFLRTGEQHAHM